MKITATTRVLGALVAGLLLGTLAGRWSTTSVVTQLLGMAQVVGTLWMNLIRMTVIPLIASLLIVGVASTADSAAVRRIGGRAFLSFLGLLCLSLVVALVLVPLLFSWLSIDAATSTALRNSAVQSAGEATAAAKQVPRFADFLTSIVPTNPFRAAADGATLPLVVFSLCFGFALVPMAASTRDPLIGVFRGIADACLTIVRWAINLAPIGVFALMLPLAAHAGVETAGALTYYVAAMGAACLGLIAALYVVVAVLRPTGLRAFAQGVLPAQAVAVSTSSSMASLPALIDGATNRLHLPAPVTSVVLPLAVSTFKVAAPVVWMVAALFLARLYGVELTALDRASIGVTALLTSFSTPGVPHGWLLVISPLLVTMGVPAEGVALLFAVDVIPDICATTANVTADMVATTLVARVAS